MTLPKHANQCSTKSQLAAQRLGQATGRLSVSDTTGQGDSQDGASVCGLDSDHTDDLLDRMRAHDAGAPGRYGPARSPRRTRPGLEGGRLRFRGDDDVVAAAWFSHAWHDKPLVSDIPSPGKPQY